MSDIAATHDDALRWRGINHLAMVTPDMDTTVRFYHRVLGMRLVGTIAVGPMKHYFFEMGSSTTIAFFEWQGTEIETYAKPAGIPPDFPAQFDHISFDLPDEAAYAMFEKVCATGYSDSLRLYKLYARAEAYAPLRTDLDSG